MVKMYFRRCVNVSERYVRRRAIAIAIASSREVEAVTRTASMPRQMTI